MAWKNIIRTDSTVMPILFKDTMLTNIADTQYNSDAFDTSTGTSIPCPHDVVTSVFCGSLEYRIDNTGVTTYLSWWLNGTRVSFSHLGYKVNYFKIAGAINDDVNGASWLGFILPNGNTEYKTFKSEVTATLQPYTAPIIVYNWQSVPSISGKNGILTLSTLNDVNDGEPVETSDVSKFNLTDDSNVSALVAAHFSQ